MNSASLLAAGPASSSTAFEPGRSNGPPSATPFLDERKEKATFIKGLPRKFAAQLRVLSTSLFLAIQGIMPRRRSPTSSMGWAAEVARMALNEGWPARFSSTQSRAKRPDWMSARIFFVAARDSGPTTRGPETYSPYSAVLETE